MMDLRKKAVEFLDHRCYLESCANDSPLDHRETALLAIMDALKSLNRPKIIGIVGKLRSGKDTTADYLIKTKGFVKYSFARPLKSGVMELFGFTEEQMYGDLKDVVDEDWGVTPRRVLQVIGTELLQFEIANHIPEFKSLGRMIWVKRFQQWHKRNSGTPVVIADVRFPHEAEAIVNMGGEIWKVERPSLKNDDGHSSETELENIPFKSKLINDGTLDDFYLKIDELISA